VPEPASAPLTADELRARFEHPEGTSIGVEEELMLLEPETLDLAPVARAALERVDGDSRFKLEMPAAQLEIVTPPCASVPDAARALAEARETLAGALRDTVRLAGAGVHPFAAGRGKLNSEERYETMDREYGEVARRQLVFGLHVHVGVSGPERALAIYNALRGHLPELAALAANAPFYEGRDTGLDSVRPKLSGLLPRQGVPPAFESWSALADTLAWGAAGRFPPRQWWWELRLHPVHGTIEVRVPDTQRTVADTAAIAAVIHALVHRLGAAHDAGDALPADPSWKIDENRWSACRHGLRGSMADLRTGRLEPTRDRVERLLEDLAATARDVGCDGELTRARRLVQGNGADAQRAVASERGVPGMTAWLADGFVPPSRLTPETGRVGPNL
jgi:carboxylate-amine ligase